MASQSQQVERALEALLFAPIGLGAKLVDDGPAIAKRVSQELSNARFIGRLTVTQGVATVRSKLEERPEPESAPLVPTVASTSEPQPTADVDAGVDGAGVDDVDDVAPVTAVDELALPDYDHLPAIDIVAKLESLSAAERSDIEAYERANRARRTVLGKLSQLVD